MTVFQSVKVLDIQTVNYFFLNRRNREIAPNKSPYDVVDDSINIEGAKLSFDIRNRDNDAILSASITALRSGKARLRIKEKNPLFPRYEVEDVLIKEPEEETSVTITCFIP